MTTHTEIRNGWIINHEPQLVRNSLGALEKMDTSESIFLDFQIPIF